MPLKDPKKRRAYHRRYMRTRWRTDKLFREKHLRAIRRNNKRTAKKAKALVATFRVHGCVGCPEKTACCLTAHHLDPRSKEFNLGDAVRGRVSLKRIARELLKCVCVCQNCHTKIHAGVISQRRLTSLVKRRTKGCGVEQPGSSEGS